MATQTGQVETLASAAQQANILKARRKFPAISNSSLSQVGDPYRFTRFNISPLSPQALAPMRAGYHGEVDSGHTRMSMLERYLLNRESDLKENEAATSPLSLASTGIAEAMPTPGFPPNIWAMLETSTTESIPRVKYIKNPWPSGTMRATTSPGTTSKQALSQEESQIPRSSPDTTPRGHMKFPRHTKHSSISIKPPFLNPELPQSTESEAVESVRPRPKVPWSQDDSGLLTPPPAPTTKGWTYSFEQELPQVCLGIERSIFDPPPAPCLDHFPEEFPTSPKISKPAPLDTTLKIVRQTGSAMNSPIVPEDRAKAILSARKPPSAPISANFPVSFPASPLRSGPAPIDTSIHHDSRDRDRSPSDFSDPGSPTPTAPPHVPIAGQFPRQFHRPTPLTIAGDKHVRFAVLKSPSLSNLRSPSYNDNIFRRKSGTPSPSADSPVTPEAMTFFHPKIVSALSPPQVPHEDSANEALDVIPPLRPRGRPAKRRGDASARARTHSPPRSDRPYADRQFAVLPATTFVPAIELNGSTRQQHLLWPAPLPKVAYHVGQNLRDDRKNILDSYFNRTT